MILNFEMSARHSEYSWPFAQGAVAGEAVFFITCHCPCFALLRKTHVPPITSNRWPCAWIETVASRQHPSPPRHVLLTGDRFGCILCYEFTGAHDCVSLDLQSSDVVTMWLDCPEAKNLIKMTCQSCYTRCSFSIAHCQPRYRSLGAESQDNWMLPHCISQRILSLTRVTGYVSM